MITKPLNYKQNLYQTLKFYESEVRKKLKLFDYELNLALDASDNAYISRIIVHIKGDQLKKLIASKDASELYVVYERSEPDHYLMEIESDFNLTKTQRQKISKIMQKFYESAEKYLTKMKLFFLEA